MAYAHEVWHAVAYGRLYQGAEIWSMGFWLGKTDGDAGDPSEGDASAVHNRVKTFFGAATSLISWAAVLDGVKIQKWNADGTLDKAATVFSSGIEAQAGGSQRNVVPQLALAVSFRGNVTRGPGANGRMFVPMFNNIPTISGNIEQNDLNGIRTNAETLFTSLNQDLSPSGNYLINASKGGINPVKPPVNVRVTNLRIGNVVDTIQRRRNGLSESYTTGVVAPPA